MRYKLFDMKQFLFPLLAAAIAFVSIFSSCTKDVINLDGTTWVGTDSTSESLVEATLSFKTETFKLYTVGYSKEGKITTKDKGKYTLNNSTITFSFDNGMIIKGVLDGDFISWPDGITFIRQD